MNASIITIGDEILIGQIIDTNSAWLGQNLRTMGIDVRQILSISDTREAILDTLKRSIEESDIVLVTGGLGPTKDDITKKVLCEFFGATLVRNEEVLRDVKSHFDRRNRVMAEVNYLQADVPNNCDVLRNPRGTAPGMWFEHEGTIVVSTPGVPSEMKGIMNDHVFPRLKQHFDLPALFHRTVLTQGMGESTLMGVIAVWEDQLRADGLSLAYLPSPSIVRLRISGKGDSLSSLKAKIDRYVDDLLDVIGNLAFGFEEDTLEDVLGRLLRDLGATVSVAESCTGGSIGQHITRVSGSSDYFKGGVIAYSNEIKENVLAVNPHDLSTFGAVSEQVVSQMARGVRDLMQSDYSIATSGIAGPSGGTEEKPVGLVWIAVASKDGVVAKQFQFGNDREVNVLTSTRTALNMLRKEILQRA